MNRKQLKSLSALSLLCLLPACVPTGAAGLPIAMLAMEAADGMGMIDDIDAVPEVEKNPALLNHPALADPRFSAYQAQLIERHAVFSADPESALSTAGALDCDLAEEAEWLILQQMTREQYEEAMRSEHYLLSVDSLNAKLLEGDCVDGWPEGEFVAAGNMVTSQHVAGNGQTTIRSERRRVDGTMNGGRLIGQLSVEGQMVMQTTGQTGRVTYTSLSLADYGEGQEFSDSLSITYASMPGVYESVSTTVIETVSPGVQTARSYQGEMLASEWTLRDGEMHGWMITHPMETVVGHTTAGQRTCYQYGKLAADAACAGSAQTSSFQAPGLLPAIQQAAAVR
ncbi:hypothetical protein [Aquibaculum arenosum]|uniref:Uncharacterized protein n=1 Tax=Aquibaculum arenosum TaxID=3032591 RepID=A0ABT5YP91_9PROT|nr:hypothetical protein [Fodinicurvata sp. CAU 1616]MDF2096704.1 hypothetical protein [Fodinicurvata sp. CAU 1616]